MTDTDPTTPAASTGCCSPTATEHPATSTQDTPCCGTTHDAAQADSCCAPAAKAEARATGAGCC
ncbi:hypothetical protein [Kitasatospora sp. NPDC059571]|uniref:hypothetical protein n=1 Tax=Kitasatospora sp. NPDC059571 TaxID=3346871 RepID=UPI0036B7192F